jgi:hypothetical protein
LPAPKNPDNTVTGKRFVILLSFKKAEHTFMQLGCATVLHKNQKSNRQKKATSTEVAGFDFKNL